MIKTNRLIIRPIHIEDRIDIFKYRSDAETNKYQGWIPESIEDIYAFIIKNPVVFNTPDTWFQLTVILAETNEIIGDIGVHFVGEEQCELGCTLSKNVHNKGYASEALRAIINVLFAKLNKHRITASIDPRNSASLKLFERLNFRKEAHFKQSIFLNGEWVDDVIYACLREEWILQ